MNTLPKGEIYTDEDGNFVMSPDTLKELTDYVEEPDHVQEELIGNRKDYCCHNTRDGRCKVIRASNHMSAALKCMAHYAGRTVNSHRGNCSH